MRKSIASDVCIQVGQQTVHAAAATFFHLQVPVAETVITAIQARSSVASGRAAMPLAPLLLLRLCMLLVGGSSIGIRTQRGGWRHLAKTFFHHEIVCDFVGQSLQSLPDYLVAPKTDFGLLLEHFGLFEERFDVSLA